jgi:hypothetical protein
MSRTTRIIVTLGLTLGCRGELEELLLSYGTERPHHGSGPGRPPQSLDPECSETFESRATVIRETFASCETDADCALVEGPGCLLAFLCTSAIARGSEEQYLNAAEIEVEDYIQECGNFCSIADCQGPSDLRAVCDTATRLCTPITVL